MTLIDILTFGSSLPVLILGLAASYLLVALLPLRWLGPLADLGDEITWQFTAVGRWAYRRVELTALLWPVRHTGQAGHRVTHDWVTSRSGPGTVYRPARRITVRVGGPIIGPVIEGELV